MRSTLKRGARTKRLRLSAELAKRVAALRAAGWQECVALAAARRSMAPQEIVALGLGLQDLLGVSGEQTQANPIGGRWQI